ncbi:MAG: PilN domain-containing protein [Dehalococcoidales bacterium]|nr:PilN domain-containing protein [Dehalococcoidales bacterium]
MAKKVTLYIDDSSLRLLVCQGPRIKEWANVPLEPGLVKNNVIIKTEEVSARIRELFKVQKVKTRAVQVGISGLHCLSRPIVLPPLPKEMLGEVVPREAKKVLPVPPDVLYLSWYSMPTSDGKNMVFIVAVPRETVDAVVQTLRSAGLRPHFLGLKPLLLTKLAKGATGIIVDVQHNEVVVVIVSEGVPQPVRTVSFANENLTWQEKLPIIVSDTERTIAFFNANNTEKILASDIPIFASGELLNQKELWETLSKKTGHPVVPLPSPLENLENFTASPYIANIALALPNAATDKNQGLSAVDFNALPEVYRPKRISPVRILALPVAVVLAALILAIALVVNTNSEGLASIQSELTKTEQLLKQRVQQKSELDAANGRLEKQINDIKIETSQSTAAIGSLENQTKGLNRDLAVIMNNMPATTKVKSITLTGDVLTVTGRAPDEKELLAYVDNLSASGVFADVTVTSIARTVNGTIDFSLLGNHEGQKIAASSLETVVNNLLPDINLRQVSYGKGSMSVSASAATLESMLNYIKLLEQSGKFSDIIVSDMSQTDAGRTEFVLILRTGE